MHAKFPHPPLQEAGIDPRAVLSSCQEQIIIFRGVPMEVVAAWKTHLGTLLEYWSFILESCSSINIVFIIYIKFKHCTKND